MFCWLHRCHAILIAIHSCVSAASAVKCPIWLAHCFWCQLYRRESSPLLGSYRPYHRWSLPDWYRGLSWKVRIRVAHILGGSYPLQIVKPIVATDAINMIYFPCRFTQRRSMKCVRNQAMDLEEAAPNLNDTVSTWMQSPICDGTAASATPPLRTHLPTTRICCLKTVIWWPGAGYNLHLQHHHWASQQANEKTNLPLGHIGNFAMLNRLHRDGLVELRRKRGNYVGLKLKLALYKSCLICIVWVPLCDMNMGLNSQCWLVSK